MNELVGYQVPDGTLAGDIARARADLDTSRDISRFRFSEDGTRERVESLEREIKHIRLALDRAVYAIEKVARGEKL